MWDNRTPRQLSWTGVDRITLGNIGHAASVEYVPSQVLIGVSGTSPTCGLNRSLQFANKTQYIFPALLGNTQKLDVVIDRNLPDYLDSATIFRKVIGQKLSDGSIDEIYLRCRMNFADDFVQTQTPKFIDLGLPTINTLN